MNEQKNLFHGKRKFLWIFLSIIFILTFVANLLRGVKSLTAVLQISYDQFLDLIDAGMVEQIYMDDTQIQIALREDVDMGEVAVMLGGGRRTTGKNERE